MDMQGVDDQLTQGLEGALEALTQPHSPKPGGTTNSTFVESEMLSAHFQLNSRRVDNACIMFDYKEQKRPLQFFRKGIEAWNVSVGRDKDSESVVPSSIG